MSSGAALSIMNNSLLIHRSAMKQASEGTEIVEVHEPQPYEHHVLIRDSDCAADPGVPTALLVATFAAVLLASLMITAALVKCWWEEWKEDSK